MSICVLLLVYLWVVWFVCLFVCIQEDCHYPLKISDFLWLYSDFQVNWSIHMIMLKPAKLIRSQGWAIGTKVMNQKALKALTCFILQHEGGYQGLTAAEGLLYFISETGISVKPSISQYISLFMFYSVVFPIYSWKRNNCTWWCWGVHWKVLNEVQVFTL